MPTLTINELVQAGIHFGHLSNEMHPKMLKYINNEIKGIQYFDLVQTITLLNKACQYLYNASKDKKTILFIGTKRYSSKLVAQEAKKCNSYYINYRWLGGILTNWSTVEKQIMRLCNLKQQKYDGIFNILPNKEAAIIRKELKKLEKYFGGIENMKCRPDIVIIVHQQHELLAIKEAKKLNIPIIGILDTNSNPDLVDFPIPANDDSFSSIQLILKNLSNNIKCGRLF